MSPPHSLVCCRIHTHSHSRADPPPFSACTCPGEDHPGPANNKGRGAPEIDLIEAERNRRGSGQVASQSAQFAPFAHDYVYLNATADQWNIYNTAITTPNPYK